VKEHNEESCHRAQRLNVPEDHLPGSFRAPSGRALVRYGGIGTPAARPSPRKAGRLRCLKGTLRILPGLTDQERVHPRLRVRVNVGGSVVPAWHARCIERLRALEGVEVSLTAGTCAYRPPRGVVAWLAGPALSKADAPALSTSDHEVDLIVDLAGSSPAQSGVETWSFRLGEDDDARWPFAREITRGAVAVEIALTRRAGGVETIVSSGRFRVTAWYGVTVRWALFVAAEWPAKVIAARRLGARMAELPPLAPPWRRPLSLVERVRFFSSVVRRAAGSVIPVLFETAQWNVGFATGEPRALLDGEPLRVTWLPDPPAGTFVADPFLVERDGRRVVFVEQYDDDRARGIIEALELDANDAVVRRAAAIDLPTHVSYPYPLEIDGALYLVPENAAAGEVALYRCVEFPWRWEREDAIFPAFDGLDTTLFAHDGLWWALCTRAGGSSDFALHAFYAGAPRGPWTPHPLNPIVEDVTRARPAGKPFTVDGVLYRPGQDCSASYGGGLVIARVDELCPLAYRETVVRRIDTRYFGRYADGVHTVCVTPSGLVLDGKRVWSDVRKPLQIRPRRNGARRKAP
jgi:hypothetical protein